MQTKTRFLRLISTSTRLLLLVAMLMTVLIGSVTPAAAAPMLLPRVGSVTLSAQSGPLSAGTSGSVTYVVTVNRGTRNTNNLTANLSITGLPAGATASFSPTNLSWTGSNASQSAPRTSTLTIDTTAGVAAGATTFTVTATRTGFGNSGDNASGDGNLVVTAAQATPTITFGAAPAPEYPGSNFTVNATTDSDGALTYGYVSGPCALVDANTGTFSPTGVGDCVVQADTAATTNFVAGSAQQTVSITGPAGPAMPTVTFGALPSPHYPGSDFTVTATTNSDGALTYSYVSGPCALVDANAGTFSPTGVGDCVVQADTAATTNFVAGSVQQTIAITLPVVDLYAVTGSTTALPGSASATVWGYNNTGATVAQPGGPTLIVNQNETVTIVLHNQLSESTALLFQGQDMIPDITGVAAGGTKSYTFIANRPGTYLYGAGLLANAQHQAAMGLYGALIVRPSTSGQAYDDVTTAFDDEAILVLSEIDPALNNSSTIPAGCAALTPQGCFDMRNYKPRYFLINGQAYPNTATIPTAAGRRVLLRYLNAGIEFHSMALIGTHQTVIANDGSPLTYAHRMVAETFGPGQTVDAIATIPAAAVDGSQFAVYDGNLMLRNSNTPGMGGMLTFLTVAGTPPTDDTTGPVTSNVAYGAGTLTATVDDTSTGGSTIAAAEYYLDSTAGAGTPMSGAFASPIEVVNALVSVPAGPHTLYVRGLDSFGNWGAFASVLVDGGDATGPVTTGPTLIPNPSNGLVDVALHATGDDSASGGSNIDAAEYFIGTDPGQGAATGMNVNVAAPIVSLDATIDTATVAGLTDGVYVVSVRSHDAAGNWGAPTTINLNVDKTGPTTNNNILATPNPNNGQVGINTTSPVVRVTADFADTATNISTAEGFIDTVGTDGTGFVFVATDGQFNSLTEAGYADIPLTTIVQLSDGNHTIYVHAKDAAGNWGPTNSGGLFIDKTAPTVTGITTLDANPTTAASVQFQVIFSEAVNGVTSGNFALATSGGLTGATITAVTGSGTIWTVTASTGSGGGVFGLNLTSAPGITDIAGNTLSTTGLPFVGQTYTVVSPPLYFSTSGNTNPPGVGGTADDADIYLWNGSAFSRVIDTNGTGSIGGPSSQVDAFDWVDATHFYMSFADNETWNPPGPQGNFSAQDEDVVYYNNGTWELFFDGSASGNGLGSGGGGSFDLDAISIVGGTLYFSTDNNNVPSGAGGTGDDADIYRWNGPGSNPRYTRMVDASALGWSSANVDGLTWVDATHIYLSYSSDTSVPGPLGIQDEDVVYYNAGTWSVYFDGTAKGLTNNNEDIDAFDLP